MSKGGKREGAGRKPRYAERMPTMHMTAPDGVFQLLERLGQGNASEGLRLLAEAHWRNDLTVYQLSEGDTLVKQVTVYQHTFPRDASETTPRRDYVIEVRTADDYSTSVRNSDAEALAYAQEVMGRELRPISFGNLLEDR